MANLIGDIEMSRGDSFPLSLYLKDKTTQKYIDISGYTFLLTVDPSETPVDDVNNVMQISGVVDADQGTNKGKVTFTPSEAETDTVGDYYYDIQYVNPAGHKKTFVKGFAFKIGQDITKQ